MDTYTWIQNVQTVGILEGIPKSSPFSTTSRMLRASYSHSEHSKMQPSTTFLASWQGRSPLTFWATNRMWVVLWRGKLPPSVTSFFPHHIHHLPSSPFPTPSMFSLPVWLLLAYLGFLDPIDPSPSKGCISLLVRPLWGHLSCLFPPETLSSSKTGTVNTHLLPPEPGPMPTTQQPLEKWLLNAAVN